MCVYVGEEQALKKLGQYGREVEYYRVQYLSVMCKEPVVVPIVKSVFTKEIKGRIRALVQDEQHLINYKFTYEREMRKP